MKYSLLLGIIVPFQLLLGDVAWSADDEDVLDLSSFQGLSEKLSPDDKDWELLRQHLTENELKELVSKLDGEKRARTRRSVVEEKRELSEEEKRGGGVRQPMDGGVTYIRDERISPFPRLGKRISPFPRLGKRILSMPQYSDPYIRYERISPFPRLGRGMAYPGAGMGGVAYPAGADGGDVWIDDAYNIE